MEGKDVMGGKVKGKKANREVSLKQKKRSLALSGGSARGDCQVELRSNKVQNP